MGAIEKIAGFITELLGLIGGPNAYAMYTKTAFEILTLLILLTLAVFSRSLAMRAPFIRRIVRPNMHRIARAPMLQVIKTFDGERRYSFIYIAWDSKVGNYRLNGYQYSNDGKVTSEFASNTLLAPGSRADSLEFVWKPKTTDSYAHIGGFTHMQFHNASNSKEPEGRGFFISFDETPERNNFFFYTLTKSQLAKLSGSKSLPKTNEQRKEFVRNIHVHLPDDIQDFSLEAGVQAKAAA